MKTFLFFLTLVASISYVVLEDLPPPCFSEIYCYGRIIDIVMKKHIFNDSKTYVDLGLKKPPNETLRSFDNFMLEVNSQPTRDQLERWVVANFNPKGSELEVWKPIDHKQRLEVYNRIKDKHLKKFASDLNEIWFELSRKMKDEVKVSEK